DIGPERDVQPRAARAQEEFVRRRQARVNQTEEGRYTANTSEIRRRQRSVELLLCHIGTDEEFAAIRRRHDLELMSLGEVWAGRTILIYNPIREKVQHFFVPVPWLVCSENMIEATIFAHDDNHVLDGRSGGDFVDGFVRIGLRLGQSPKAKDRRYKHRCAKKGFCSPFAGISAMHTFS